METTAARISSTGTNASIKQHYDQNYALHLKHLKLKGMRPKTIEAYSRAIRRIGARFEYQIDKLTEAHLRGHAHPQLPGILLRPLQHGPAPRRRAAPASGRY